MKIIISEPHRICRRQNTGSQESHFPIAEPVTVTLYVKRDFADMIKLQILRWGNHLGLPGWAQCNPMQSHVIPCKGKGNQEGKSQ